MGEIKAISCCATNLYFVRYLNTEGGLKMNGMDGTIDVILGIFVLLILVYALWSLNPIISILLLIIGGLKIFYDTK
jgi:hypothetical protein